MPMLSNWLLSRGYTPEQINKLNEPIQTPLGNILAGMGLTKENMGEKISRARIGVGPPMYGKAERERDIRASEWAGNMLAGMIPFGVDPGSAAMGMAAPIRAINPNLLVKYPREYYSPREKLGRPMTETERETRRISYGLKEGNPGAVYAAADEMAPYVKKDNILIPIPSSGGSTEANLKLAQELAEMTGATVKDVLRKSRPTGSQMLRAKSGEVRLPPEALAIMAIEKISDPSRVLFVDNVAASGATLEAARRAVGGGSGLTFSNAAEHPIF